MISEPKLRRTEIRKVQSIDNTTGYVVFMNDTFDGLPRAEEREGVVHHLPKEGER